MRRSRVRAPAHPRPNHASRITQSHSACRNVRRHHCRSLARYRGRVNSLRAIPAPTPTPRLATSAERTAADTPQSQTINHVPAVQGSHGRGFTRNSTQDISRIYPGSRPPPPPPALPPDAAGPPEPAPRPPPPSPSATPRRVRFGTVSRRTPDDPPDRSENRSSQIRVACVVSCRCCCCCCSDSVPTFTSRPCLAPAGRRTPPAG